MILVPEVTMLTINTHLLKSFGNYLLAQRTDSTVLSL